MDEVKNLLIDIASDVIDQESLNKLYALNNEHVLKIVNEFVSLSKPSKITVITDSQEDINYIRQKAIEIGEEAKLSIDGHTIHYDAFTKMSYHDQARDKENTRVLVPKGEYASPWINTIDRDAGLKDILEIMDGCMKGNECIVRFFCLGSTNSKLINLELILNFQ